MRTVKRIVVLACCVAVCLCIAGRIKSRADTLPNASEILATLPGIDLTSITEIYSELTSEQTMIANYLLGAFNNIYLCARGFQYNIPADESNLKAQFIALGNRAWNYATSLYAGRSRVNELFRQYLSGILVYVQSYNDFDDWYDEIRYGGNTTLYIPYSEDAFDAWTTFYNDPSGDGIASFGDVISEWQSGEFYDFAYVGFAWTDSAFQTVYNNFILNNNPILYSNEGVYMYSNRVQYVFTLSDYPDALFIQRGQSYQYYRFGFSNMSYSPVTIKYVPVYKDDRNKLSLGSWSYFQDTVNFNTVNTGSTYTLSSIIDKAFNSSIIPTSMFAGAGPFKYYYPFIEHVYLVDNLTTLSNPEEVFNTDSLNVVAPGNSDFIITPNGKFLSPVWPIADGDPMNLLDNIIDNSVDVDMNPVSEDDYHTNIVNNNVINNYYVSDSDLINVPVEWFDNQYTQQLGEDAIPFIGFARDCIDTLGDLDIYMYGAIVIGLGGGIVKKLLL